MKIEYKAKIEELANQAKYFRDLKKELGIVKAENSLKKAKGEPLPAYTEEDLKQVETWIENALENCFIGYEVN